VSHYRKCFALTVKPLIFALPARKNTAGKAHLHKPLLAEKKLKKSTDIFGRIEKVCIFALPIKKG
jgi:hypothetical protein